MDNNLNNNLPPTIEPTQVNSAILPIQKNWYQHKGIIAVITLTVIAAASVLAYTTLSQPQNLSPIIVTHHPKLLEQDNQSQTPTSTPINSVFSSTPISTTTTAYTAPPAKIDTTNWKTYNNTKYGFQFNYPNTWTDASRTIDTEDFFTKSPQVEVLDLAILDTTGLTATGSLFDIANSEIKKNNCPANDHIIQYNDDGALYVLNCSATSEDYNYIFRDPAGQIIQLTYHDDFDENWTEAQKIQTFNAIIGSLFDEVSWSTYTSSDYGFKVYFPVFDQTYKPDVEKQNAPDGSFAEAGINFGNFAFGVDANTKNLSLQDWFEKNVDDNGILLKNGNYKIITTKKGVKVILIQEGVDMPDEFYGDLAPDEFYAETPDGKYIISYGYDYQSNDLELYGYDGLKLQKQILDGFNFTQ